MATLTLLSEGPRIEAPYPGIDAVLRTALRFIAEGAADPRMAALAAEVALAAGANPHNAQQVADAMYRYLAKKVTYKTDPPGVEDRKSGV